jgi:hypothetical protein
MSADELSVTARSLPLPKALLYLFASCNKLISNELRLIQAVVLRYKVGHI